MRYQVIGLFDALGEEGIGRPGDLIHFLGTEVQVNGFNQEEQREILVQLFKNTPWLTYRSGFPQLYHDLKGTYVTDTGWGCMIRVGQMALAQIMKRHLGVTSQERMNPIIELFNDVDKNQPFSIHSISKMAWK